MDTLDLALELGRDRGIVGVDVCGDPTTGSFEAIKPAVLRAKKEGMKGLLGTTTRKDFGKSDQFLVVSHDSPRRGRRHGAGIPFDDGMSTRSTRPWNLSESRSAE
jgi:hypothetical protein